MYVEVTIDRKIKNDMEIHIDEFDNELKVLFIFKNLNSYIKYKKNIIINKDLLFHETNIIKRKRKEKYLKKYKLLLEVMIEKTVPKVRFITTKCVIDKEIWLLNNITNKIIPLETLESIYKNVTSKDTQEIVEAIMNSYHYKEANKFDQSNSKNQRKIIYPTLQATNIVNRENYKLRSDYEIKYI